MSLLRLGHCLKLGNAVMCRIKEVTGAMFHAWQPRLSLAEPLLPWKL